MANDPLISVVIPVKNGDAWLDKTLAAIYRQSLAHSIEVIVIDSGSTDNTFSILDKYPVRLWQIEPGSFNHGSVRNLGASYARGRFVAMTVQDAEPVDENWLQQLLNGFSSDDVAGVCGLQVVPHDTDKNPVDWFRPLSPPQLRKFSFDPRAFDALDPELAQRFCSWDNVNAMYRREVMLSIPFKAVSFAEDALWARDALRSGYSIVYNAAAQVKHYHYEDGDYTFRRNLTVHYHFYKFFGTRPGHHNNEFISILKNIKLLVKENKVGWADKFKWLVFNYRRRQAAAKAVAVFNKALKKGEAVLDDVHAHYCGIAPQAMKPLITIRAIAV